MYKTASRNLQRRSTHIEAASYVTADDFIPSAGNFSLSECQSERGQLLIEKTRAENELIAAKQSNDIRLQARLGLRLQSLCGRLGLLGARIKDLNKQHSNDCLYQAVEDVLPADLRRKVLDRARAIRDERNP